MFTWNDGIFFIHCAYGIDPKFVGTLDPTVSAKVRDTDRPDAFFVHFELFFGYLAGICQYEIVKGDLVEVEAVSLFVCDGVW